MERAEPAPRALYTALYEDDPIKLEQCFDVAKDADTMYVFSMLHKKSGRTDYYYKTVAGFVRYFKRDKCSAWLATQQAGLRQGAVVQV